MRTTINMPASLIARVKRRALELGTTFTQFVTDAVHEKLARRRAESRAATQLTTFGAGGVFPGVDLDDTSALLDRMEGITATRNADDPNRR
jgi:hypothetical protein